MKIVKKSIRVLLVLFIIESIVFQVYVIKKISDMKFHSHILDEGSILTFDELIDKKGGLYDISDDYCMKFNRATSAGKNTLIDAVLVNTSGVNLSGINFEIYSRKLTEEGKKRQATHVPFSRKDFENDDYCTGRERLDARDVDVNAEPGKPAAIRIIIKNHVMAVDEIFLIRGNSKYVQYDSQNM